MMGSPSKVRVAGSPSKAAEGSPRKAAAKLSSTTGVVKTIEKKVPKMAAAKASGEGKTGARAKKGKTAAKGDVAEGGIVRKAQVGYCVAPCSGAVREVGWFGVRDGNL